jgi:hypothetical protein
MVVTHETKNVNYFNHCHLNFVNLLTKSIIKRMEIRNKLFSNFKLEWYECYNTPTIHKAQDSKFSLSGGLEVLTSIYIPSESVIVQIFSFSLLYICHCIDLKNDNINIVYYLLEHCLNTDMVTFFVKLIYLLPSQCVTISIVCKTYLPEQCVNGNKISYLLEHCEYWHCL